LVPNPADDVFILTIDRALTGEVRVMDLAGRVALTVPLAVDRARIPTAGLNAGTYLVEVVDRNG
ncbi:MAG: T9SS type A sorting domain-containing protein, partial [Flavobacteriales bacterium]|nr:T9SS type A sorting domain-containing protein [Flavobacteriales bacterium]